MNEHGGGSPTAVFVLEQTLGHVTHAANLRALVPRIGTIDPTFVDVPFATPRHVPIWSNWTVRAGARAATSLMRLRRSGVRADVLFVHTQVPAVLLGYWMRRIPTIVSLDATPEQYDTLGEFYAHRRGRDRVERAKHRMNQRCFERAAHLVTWSEWARQGLVSEYGIQPDQITVIAPGVDVHRWQPVTESRASDGPVRILFVGGDLKRKGGDLLIEAVRRLREDASLPDVELHLVTNATVAAGPGVVVHAGLSPNSAELIAQYRAADIFCLPTLGDCLPMVLAEAAAVGLPIVSTDVGAIHEIVRPDETGLLVPPGDLDALVDALRRLVADPDLRRRYGQASCELATRDHDAQANASRIVELLRTAASRGRH